MTPHDVPGPVITIETLSPWLAALTPAAEPVRSVAARPAAPAAPSPSEPLRPAA